MIAGTLVTAFDHIGENHDQTVLHFVKSGSLLLRLPSPEHKKTVMAQLASNYDIDEVKIYEPSLNDIFIEYAGDGAKEE